VKKPKKTKEDYAVIRISKKTHELLLQEKEDTGITIERIVSNLAEKNIKRKG